MKRFENLKMKRIMKAIFNHNAIAAISLKFLACILLIGFISLQSCKKDDPGLTSDQVKEILTANAWKLTNVTVDGVDKTTLYAGLTLSFTDTNYTTTNGGVVWPASGTWTFADATGKLITRSDGLSITVEEVIATSLRLRLTWAKATLGGRVESLAGVHVFSFGK
jgi:hypothetical protein